jgi:2'-hydroxyisoflavone reductase
VKLLVLGGTLFLGRHVVEAALGRGHEVTLFNRGRTDPTAHPEVRRLRGDRDGDLAALEGSEWDAVVDTSGYVPRVVAASAKLLAERVGHYTFVSSISVYRDFSKPGFDEGSRLGTLVDESVEQVDGQTYGPLKALCERAVGEALPGRAAIVRAGLIVGPYDPTNRFTYWVTRIADGGDVLGPEPRRQPVQLVDARDLADWIVSLGESRAPGVFNATGPEQPLTLEYVLSEIRSATHGGTRFVWVDEDFVREAELEPFHDLPLWIGSDPEWSGFLSADVSRAVAAGLRFRPLSETILDTLAWTRAQKPVPSKELGVPMIPAGISRKREAELLAAWRERRAA